MLKFTPASCTHDDNGDAHQEPCDDGQGSSSVIIRKSIASRCQGFRDSRVHGGYPSGRVHNETSKPFAARLLLDVEPQKLASNESTADRRWHLQFEVHCFGQQSPSPNPNRKKSLTPRGRSVKLKDGLRGHQPRGDQELARHAILSAIHVERSCRRIPKDETPPPCSSPPTNWIRRPGKGRRN